MTWHVEFVDGAAKAEMDQLPVDLRAKFERIVMLIKAKGVGKGTRTLCEAS